jgi:SAM-dependent methyltransferase
MDWQAQYEMGETPWDEGGVHPALVDFVAEAGEFKGQVLVPGCGRGNDVRGISTERNQVIGLDIAPAAIAIAQEFPRVGREEYVVADLFDPGAGMRGSFDWVIEHTCFCAINPRLRPAYVPAVAGALKPGGKLFAIFYLDPAVERHPPYGVSVPELDGLFSPYFAMEREWVPTLTFEGRESRELVRVLRRL